ncbi:MAG TPA: exodeoxyribonuclease III [Gammaproteobacteria bacterium]|nr:exodeoxyribonuclease III [Gammaproteobacteria bacterium]
MKIISFNANGLRSAARKGFFDWFAEQEADVLCVQELKAQAEQLEDEAYHATGYRRYLFPAERPGYSGVAIYSRIEPSEIVTGYANTEFDAEGRYLEAVFDDFSVASVYFPSGSSSPERQIAKFRFLESFEAHMAALLGRGKPCILCGDINIAHKEIDLRNWRSNQKNSGFTPEERAWLDHLFDEVGYVDAFRVVNQSADEYTWWSNRGRAWEKNVGWRIDYHLITPDLKPAVSAASVFREQRYSDHAPLILEYDLPTR